MKRSEKWYSRKSDSISCQGVPEEMQAGILTIVLAYRKREIFYGRNIDIRLMYLSYTST